MATKRKVARPKKKAVKRVAKAKAKKKGGRPRSPINWKQFDKLCEIQCSEEEIAIWFGVSVDTVARACKHDKKMGFAEYVNQKREAGKVSLRRKQFQSALAGNVTMLIWLGKNVLSQADKHEIDWRTEAVKKGLNPEEIRRAMVTAAKAELAAKEQGAEV